MKQTDLHTYAGKIVSQPSGYGFAAIRDCGCVVAGVIDEPAYREHAAEKRFEFRSRRLNIDHMPLSELNQRLAKFLDGCQHKVANAD